MYIHTYIYNIYKYIFSGLFESKLHSIWYFIPKYLHFLLKCVFECFIKKYYKLIIHVDNLKWHFKEALLEWTSQKHYSEEHPHSVAWPWAHLCCSGVLTGIYGHTGCSLVTSDLRRCRKGWEVLDTSGEARSAATGLKWRQVDCGGTVGLSPELLQEELAIGGYGAITYVMLLRPTSFQPLSPSD